MSTYNGAIGIDLGTTYSCVAVWEYDKVKIIVNGEGARSTPSYVAFTKGGCIVGEAAKKKITANPENTVYDVKRLIGRKFTDKCVQNDMKHWPFKVIDRGDNTPVVEVTDGGETKMFTAEEISAKILEYMKEAAEKYLGESVTKAVITVPAYFNNAQRQATKKAAELVKLEVLRIINEPTAAAIAYGCDRTNDNKKHNVLIYDLGGGTFDVTLLTVNRNEFTVKATDGDTHLGGEDFDNCLVNYFRNKYRREHGGKDLIKSNSSRCRLKKVCEQVKRELSSMKETEFVIDSFCNGEDYEEKVTRVQFEELCGNLFQSTIPVIIKVLQDANIDKRDIDDVVLVGGSTRIPKVKSILSDFFDGKDLKQSINPDEAVAYGAAVQAFILAGGKSKQTDKLRLSDVTPLTLGLQNANEEMIPIIRRNTTIPVKNSYTFSTSSDNQEGVAIQVFEGEKRRTSECNLLASFRLSGIPPAPRGVPQIEVIFDLNANGILTVTAKEKNSNKSIKMVLAKDSGSTWRVESSPEDAHAMPHTTTTQRQTNYNSTPAATLPDTTFTRGRQQFTTSESEIQHQLLLKRLQAEEEERQLKRKEAELKLKMFESELEAKQKRQEYEWKKQLEEDARRTAFEEEQRKKREQDEESKTSKQLYSNIAGIVLEGWKSYNNSNRNPPETRPP